MIKPCVVKETAKEFFKGLGMVIGTVALAIGGLLALLCSVAAFLHLFRREIEHDIMWMVYGGYLTFAGILVYSIYGCYKDAKIKCELKEARVSIKENQKRLT